MAGGLRAIILAGFASACLASASAQAAPLAQPLRFFEGRTEGIGTMKTIVRRPYKMHSIGRGTIARDGSLTLVQEVRGDGEKPHQRIWKIHQVAPTKYSGTMSEAVGPVTIEQIGEGYRFRYEISGGLVAEEWLVPNADGKSGSSTLVVRKFGVAVAWSDGVIRRVSE